MSARFAVACTVFFAAFFALPLWLLQSSRLGAVETGAAMAPMVIVSALTTPIAARTVSRSGAAAASLVGAGGLCLGTGLLVTMNAQTSVVVPIAAMVALGAAHAFNNLGLQAQLTGGASPGASEPRPGSFKPRGSLAPRWLRGSLESRSQAMPARTIGVGSGSRAKS